MPGARHIRVEIEGGGADRILVADDGHGIAADEVELAFRRHATSKLRTESDLSELATLGFRGEALPSIAAVADVTCSTRGPAEPGWRGAARRNGRHRAAAAEPPAGHDHAGRRSVRPLSSAKSSCVAEARRARPACRSLRRWRSGSPKSSSRCSSTAARRCVRPVTATCATPPWRCWAATPLTTCSTCRVRASTANWANGSSRSAACAPPAATTGPGDRA